MKVAEGDVSHVAGAAPRVLFLDVLRCAAAFQMIQGHSIAALLAPEHRHGVIHALWFAARGLTSVAFLFTAGFAFHWTTARGYAQRHRDVALFARRARRAASLVALGYLLRAPFGWLLSRDPLVQAAALRGFVAVDVLHCIGVSLLTLQVLAWLCRSAARLGGAAALVSLAIFVATPLAMQLLPSGGSAALTAYVSPRAGSLFPLFPWAGHMFFGAACSAWVARPGPGGPQARLARVGVALLVASWLLRATAGSFVVADHLGRLGCVVLVAALLAWGLARTARLPPVVARVAGDTLFLYAFHVLLVYAAGVGLADRIGPRLGPLAALGWAAVVLVLSFGLSLWRTRPKRLARAAAAG